METESVKMKETVSLKRLRPGAKIPAYGTENAAGCDLYACVESTVVLRPGETAMIPTGWAMEIPVGFAGLIFARSGLATKSGLAPANKVGVIDPDYRGEVCVALFNHSGSVREIEPGDRIAQLVIVPYLTAVFAERETLSETERAGGGFGSTGKN